MSGSAKTESQGIEEARQAHEETRAVLAETQAALVSMSAMLKRIGAAPCAYGAVVKVYDVEPDPETGISVRAILSKGGELTEVEVAIDREKLHLVKRGSVVRLAPMIGSIIGVVENPEALGSIVVCGRAVGDDRVEIDATEGKKLLAHGLEKVPEEGTQLLVDPTQSVVIRDLGKPPGKKRIETIRTTWSDVGGLEEAKAAMIEAIEMPIKHADKYKRYGKKPVKGVLLYGAPGCGKTLLARAAATAISEVNSFRGEESNFIYVKGPELLNKWVGNTESYIRGLFAQAREHFRNHGYPAIIFIDEADALLGKRGGAGGGHFMSGTVVPQFLSEMDGLEESGAIVLLSTNRADVLDPAVVREGRIDRKVRIGRPNQKAAEEILKLHLRGKPIAENISLNELAALGAEAIFSRDLILYDVEGEVDNYEKFDTFALSDMVNGAMIAAIVDQATTNAINREILGQGNLMLGLTAGDFASALISVFNGNQHLDHSDTVREFAEGRFSKVTALHKRAPLSAQVKSNGNGGKKKEDRV